MIIHTQVSIHKEYNHLIYKIFISSWRRPSVRNTLLQRIFYHQFFYKEYFTVLLYFQRNSSGPSFRKLFVECPPLHTLVIRRSLTLAYLRRVRKSTYTNLVLQQNFCSRGNDVVIRNKLLIITSRQWQKQLSDWGTF